MARRASSKSSPLSTIGILAALILVLGGGFFLLNKKSSGFSDPPLPIDAFLNNANSLRGNVYSVEGQIHSIRPRDDGKFVHLRVDENGQDRHVFVVVPNELNKINLEREQSYAFKIEIKNGGIPMTRKLSRL